mgnify:FL=1
MDRYCGMLSSDEIDLIVSKVPELEQRLTTEFIVPESIEEATLENKFIESIMIQH